MEVRRPAGEVDTGRSQLGHEFMRWTRTFHLMKDEMARLLPSGLDPAAAQLLSWLARTGPTRQNELAEATYLDPSTVSRRISQLVAQRLVERRADPMDGRASQLLVTAQGQELFRAMCAVRDQLMHQALADWPDADVVQLVGLLRRFNDDFEAYRGQRGPHAVLSSPVAAPPPALSPRAELATEI